MAEISFVTVFTTVADGEEAKLLAGVLLEHKKAACVSIVPGITSLFNWKKRTEEVSEYLLIIKTRASLATDVTALLKEKHSYQNPEIIALPIIGGSSEYMNWIAKETEETK